MRTPKNNKAAKRTKILINYEPVLANKFEIDFDGCASLTATDKKLLKEMVVFVQPEKMKFNLNSCNGKLIPFNALKKIASCKKPIKLIIKLHDKKGVVFGNIEYINCSFTINASNLVQLSYDTGDDDFSFRDDEYTKPKHLLVHFAYESVKLNGQQVCVSKT